MKKLLRKNAILLMMSFSTISLSTTASAQTLTEKLLLSLNNITYTILEKVNKIPNYIESITQMAESWINTEDPNNYFATSQFSFATLTNNTDLITSAQLSTTQDVTSKFLLQGSPNPNSPVLPNNANELNYAILFGQTLPGTEAPKDPNAVDELGKTYIKNLAGAGIPLNQPSPNWVKGSATTSYQNFYNTMVAVKSLNTYMLGNVYKTQENEKTINDLIKQSGSSDWFKQIATEPLGAVLRQILMYDSQIYIQLTRLIKLQQQMLVEQAATNSLIAMEAQSLTGDQLWQKAQMARNTQ